MLKDFVKIVIPGEARNLALIPSSSAQSQIPRFARNDSVHKRFSGAS
jgi:hypothetical protein